MLHRTLISILFVLLACAACFGQSTFMGLTPGRSTRADVERVLGEPVRKVSETLVEYRPQPLTGQIFVQYQSDDQVVMRIELFCRTENSTCDDLLESVNLRLPSQPTASRTNKGKLQEYFSPKNVVLTYAAAAATSDVSQVGYYSRELFESALAKAPGERQGPATRPGPSGGGLGEPNLPAGMLPPGSSSASVDRSGRISTSGADAPAAGPGGAEGTTATTRSHPSPVGGSPMTVTTRPGSGREAQPPISVEIGGDEDADTAEREISLSAAELRRLVGRYEFIQSTTPDLKLAVVELVAGKLRLTMGSARYPLVPVTGGGIAVGARKDGEVVHFKVVGRPGVKAHFAMSGGKVEHLFIVEEQSEPVGFSVAVPKS